MDLREIEKIIKLVEESGIDELEVEEGGTRIRVKKHLAVAPPPLAYEHAVPVAAQAMPAAKTAPEKSVDNAPAQSEPDSKSTAPIPSPMVGTFYRSPSPDAPPFIQIGSVVNPDTVVCILEAMKVMNEIKAGISGKVTEILVENAQAVEFGQPLFRVSTT
jgi:acetyl-CoA carboxylase biotin carboxyl carrier protein